MPAGQAGEQLGLVRSLIYAAEYLAMNALLFYRTKNCCSCALAECLPICQPDTDAKPAWLQKKGLLTATFEPGARSPQIAGWFDGPSPDVVIGNNGLIIAFASSSSYRSRD
jgi:hypothetical protein